MLLNNYFPPLYICHEVKTNFPCKTICPKLVVGGISKYTGGGARKISTTLTTWGGINIKHGSVLTKILTTKGYVEDIIFIKDGITCSAQDCQRI